MQIVGPIGGETVSGPSSSSPTRGAWTSASDPGLAVVSWGELPPPFACGTPEASPCGGKDTAVPGASVCAGLGSMAPPPPVASFGARKEEGLGVSAGAGALVFRFADAAAFFTASACFLDCKCCLYLADSGATRGNEREHAAVVPTCLATASDLAMVWNSPVGSSKPGLGDLDVRVICGHSIRFGTCDAVRLLTMAFLTVAFTRRGRSILILHIAQKRCPQYGLQKLRSGKPACNVTRAGDLRTNITKPEVDWGRTTSRPQTQDALVS